MGGCPVTMTVTFEDTDRDVIRVNVYRRAHRGGIGLQSFVVPVTWLPEASAAPRKGEASIQVRPEEYGRHSYLVQVEDALGHRSNVLHEFLLVYGPLPWRPLQCD
jgi:hypothetical protein